MNVNRIKLVNPSPRDTKRAILRAIAQGLTADDTPWPMPT